MVNKLIEIEIREKMEHIVANPDLYDERARGIKDALANLADLYSFWVENPELRRFLVNGQRSEETVKKEAMEGHRRIQDAWYYLNQFSRSCNFVNALDGKVIRGTNSLICGGKAAEGRFRTSDVTLNFAHYTPPSFQKVPSLVDETVGLVRDNYFHHPVDAAIYAHLAIALIQPFDNANKRTARLVQNQLLMDYGYPPIIIPPGEARFYFQLLEEAVPAFQSRQVVNGAKFTDYMASKINVGLDRILGDLEVDGVDLLLSS